MTPGQKQDADNAWSHLKSLPVHDPERPKLRDKVRGDFAALERKAHKYLTLAAEYNARKGPHPLQFDGKGLYAKHVASACRRTPMAPQVFDFPDGDCGSFEHYAERFDMRNGLKLGVTFWFSKD